MKPQNTIPAGEFKAKCLKIMDQVQDKHQAVTITKYGKPVAKLVPIEHDDTPQHFGCMKTSITIKDDITRPIDVDWDAEHD